MRPVAAAVLVGVVLTTAACGVTAGEDPDGSASGDGQGPAPGLVVLTSVDPITDLAQQVLGDRGEASSLVAAGDSHTFEPSPRDAIRMSEADLFLANGLGLNEAAVALAEANLPQGAPIVILAELALGEGEVVVGEESHAHNGEAHAHEGEANPHVWMNVAHAIDYVGHISQALADRDPAGASTYEENAAAYIRELEALDQAIAEAIATIPPENRTLVTYHDSWAYFGPRYGLDHVEAVQPDDFSEPSAAEVRTMVDEIRALGVPAVFGAREFPSDVLATIADATGATYVADLSDDEFPGEPGDPEHSYIGMLLANARAITDGLGGDTSALDAVDPAP